MFCCQDAGSTTGTSSVMLSYLRVHSYLLQALITAHSSLSGVGKHDGELFKERFLPGAIAAFSKLRRAVDLTIRDLGNELGRSPMVIPLTQARYDEYMDLEQRKQASASTMVSMGLGSPEDELSTQMASLSDRLAAEVENATSMPTQTRTSVPDPRLPENLVVATEGGSISRESSREYPSKAPSQSPDSPTAATSAYHGRQLSSECGMQRLRREFDAFSAAQYQLLQDALVRGELWDTDLRLHQPRASLKEMFGADGVGRTQDAFSPYAPTTMRQRTKSDEKDAGSNVEEGMNIESESTQDAQDSLDASILMNGQSLMRVWGFLFALE